MKKLFNIIAVMLLVAPLLMATKCANQAPPNTDEGCQIPCLVHLNYVDQNGQRVQFGTQGYPDTVYYARCQGWKDQTTGYTLNQHNPQHAWLSDGYVKELAHAHILAAPEPDRRTHPQIKGELFAQFGGPSIALKDVIEVELHYDTPKIAYIEVIKINGEVRWDRSTFAPDKIPQDIIVDIYLDPNRFK